MSRLGHRAFGAAEIGILWAFVIAVTVSVILSFSTGVAFRPGLPGIVICGAVLGLAGLHQPGAPALIVLAAALGSGWGLRRRGRF